MRVKTWTGDKTISVRHLRQLPREAPRQAHSDLWFEFGKFRAAAEVGGAAIVLSFLATLLLSLVDWVGGFGLFDWPNRYRLNEFFSQVATFVVLSLASCAGISGYLWWQSIQRHRHPVQQARRDDPSGVS